MPPKPLSLRTKLALRHSLFFGVVVALVMMVAFTLMVQQLDEQLDQRLQQRAAVVRSSLQVKGGVPVVHIDSSDREVNEFLRGAARFYQVMDSNGQVQDASHDATLLKLPITPTALEALSTRRALWETLSGAGGARLRVYNAPVLGDRQKEAYLLRVGVPLNERDAQQRRLAIFFLLLLPVVILLEAMHVWWIARRALRPVSAVATATRQITTSDLNKRLPLSGSGDELDRLSDTINGLLARLQTAFQQMCEFLPRLSHELRRPLAVMRSESELALRWASSEKDYRNVLSNQIDQFELLMSIMNSLQAVVQADSGQLQLSRKSENLAELLRAAVDGMQGPAAERGVDIAGVLPEEVMADIDTGHVWRLLLNLLDNAVKYNRSYGRVEVDLTVKNGWAVISITDTGIGIAAEDLPHICEYFYRSADAKNHGVQGTGLGLSFARAIAHAHGGRIEVNSTPGVGSRFQVWLPQVAGGKPANPSVTASASAAAD